MCGLFSWVSDDPKNWTGLNKFKFELLGVENDIRGGDGCGIFYDDTVVKSEVIKKFDDFWRGGNVPSSLEHPFIVGHDRKSSVGGHTYVNTQPIFHENISTVIVHNGTLLNHVELFNKYKILDNHAELNTTGMSDSQIFCLLLHYKGWKILEEYTGTAALIVSTGNGKVFVYHGSSPARKGVVILSEERPLHYAVDNESIWFSSTGTALTRIISDKSKIKEVPFNKVFEVVGTTLTEVYSVDRSNAFQQEAFSTTYYGEYSSKKESACNASASNSSYPKSGSVISLKVDDDASDIQGFIGYKAGSWRGKLISPGVVSEQLEGQVFVTHYGKHLRIDDLPKDRSCYRVFYFWRGNFCKNREAYLACVKNELELPHLVASPIIFYINAKHFIYPFMVPVSNYGDAETIFSAKEFIKGGFVSRNGTVYDLYNIKFSGVFTVPGRRTEFKFAGGRIESRFYSNAAYGTFSTISWDKIDDYDFLTYNNAYDEMCESIASGNTIQDVDNETVIVPPVIEEVENEPTYCCPLCFGNKPDVLTCMVCDGEGVITKHEAIEIISSLAGKDIEELKCRIDVLGLQDHVLSILEEVITEMEEPSMKSVNEDFYEVLIKTKTNIEKCLQS